MENNHSEMTEKKSLGQQDTKIHSKNISVHYALKQALFNVNLEIRKNEVTALIGPSGCGKSTFLRCINRMNDLIENCSVEGSLTLDGNEINNPDLDVVHLRRMVGMVFQKPNPFPKTIYENVSYGPTIHGMAQSKSELDQIVEMSLKKAALWEEVKDRLDEIGTGLSGGQQQRLCIARAISVSPEVILMDEPCSALDPIATAQIEELIDESIIAINSSGKGLLPAPSLFIYFLSIIAAAISRKNLSID